jgi:hypothetical protein
LKNQKRTAPNNYTWSEEDGRWELADQFDTTVAIVDRFPGEEAWHLFSVSSAVTTHGLTLEEAKKKAEEIL